MIINHDWTWEQIISECIVDFANCEKIEFFTVEKLYERYANLLSLRFPKNRFIREKVRQKLQALRDLGFIESIGKGSYRLLINSPYVVDSAEESQIYPKTQAQTKIVRLRDRILSTKLKEIYNYKCQACNKRVVIDQKVYYAETHHLRPIGEPHKGPDVPGNLLVLCPNCHAMFDRGAIFIKLISHNLIHKVKGVLPENSRIILLAPHNLVDSY